MEPYRFSRFAPEEPPWWEPGNLMATGSGLAGGIVGGIYGGPVGAYGGWKTGSLAGRGVGSLMRSDEQQAAADRFARHQGQTEWEQYKPWSREAIGEIPMVGTQAAQAIHGKKRPAVRPEGEELDWQESPEVNWWEEMRQRALMEREEGLGWPPT